MAETRVASRETIGERRRNSIYAEMRAQLAGGTNPEDAGIFALAKILENGYKLGEMGISLDIPAEEAEILIAEWEEKHPEG